MHPDHGVVVVEIGGIDVAATQLQEVDDLKERVMREKLLTEQKALEAKKSNMLLTEDESLTSHASACPPNSSAIFLANSRDKSLIKTSAPSSVNLRAI